MTKIMLYRARHIKCYRAIALKLLIISKNVSDISISVNVNVKVFEKAVILDHPISLSGEALKLRQGQIHFLK